MRIVIDDTKLTEAVDAVNKLMKCVPIKSLVKYDYGMDRVQSHLFKDWLNKNLRNVNFEIGNTVTHANGIGNNCQYPLYYNGNTEETQQVGYININSGMYSEVYCSIYDYNQKRVSMVYEIMKRGVKIS